MKWIGRMVGAVGGVMVLCVLAVALGGTGQCSSVPSGSLTVPEIEGVWEQAGGPATVAPTMAAIAMAESGGKPSNVQQGQPYSRTGWGLWQITPGDSEPQFGVDQQLLDPLRNGHAAVAKWRAQGLAAWTTYTSGAYAQYLPASTVTPVSFITGTACASPNGHGVVNPLPGFTHGRDDMGVDGCATPGAPIVAPAASQLIEVVPGWYGPQPLLLFRFVAVPAGAASAYWYAAEQITPATMTLGTVFRQGQPVAHYAPQGTCVELGWGSPTSNSRTLASQLGDSAAANPPPGATTVWGETFRRFFGIP